MAQRRDVTQVYVEKCEYTSIGEDIQIRQGCLKQAPINSMFRPSIFTYRVDLCIGICAPFDNGLLRRMHISEHLIENLL